MVLEIEGNDTTDYKKPESWSKLGSVYYEN